MFPNAKPPAETNARTHRVNEQLSSIQPPERVTSTNATHNNYHNDWAGTAGQLDHFASAGFHGDFAYRTALMPDRMWSISPIRRSGRPASTVKTAEKQTYPSQELNPRYAGLHLSPPNSDGSWNLSPLPPLPPLPPLLLPQSSLNTDGFARKLHVEEVTSLATLPEHSPDIARKFHAEEVTSMTTGYKNQREVYNFELDVDANVIAAQPKSEGLDVNDRCNRRSAIPSKKKHHASRATKAPKGSSKKKPGIAVPNDLDILRGRGGVTNRHEGNKRFRDEARTMRAKYRHENTNRDEKFLLSQELCKRVKEYGGRFLELGDDKLWHEMNEHSARKKASQVLREEKWK
ncbi:hypothetical protein ACHAW5_004615 [Stephanodiscus triporus]|uniref:DUF6824 domain-containing protein n=1 Tax=Stephanodiscus triporus TaxID=2934178 RepID=A0ABD3QU62_9STRA